MKRVYSMVLIIPNNTKLTFYISTEISSSPPDGTPAFTFSKTVLTNSVDVPAILKSITIRKSKLIGFSNIFLRLCQTLNDGFELLSKEIVTLYSSCNSLKELKLSKVVETI